MGGVCVVGKPKIDTTRRLRVDQLKNMAYKSVIPSLWLSYSYAVV